MVIADAQPRPEVSRGDPTPDNRPSSCRAELWPLCVLPLSLSHTRCELANISPNANIYIIGANATLHRAACRIHFRCIFNPSTLNPRCHPAHEADQLRHRNTSRMPIPGPTKLACGESPATATSSHPQFICSPSPLPTRCRLRRQLKVLPGRRFGEHLLRREVIRKRNTPNLAHPDSSLPASPHNPGSAVLVHGLLRNALRATSAIAQRLGSVTLPLPRFTGILHTTRSHYQRQHVRYTSINTIRCHSTAVQQHHASDLTPSRRWRDDGAPAMKHIILRSAAHLSSAHRSLSAGA